MKISHRQGQLRRLSVTVESSEPDTFVSRLLSNKGIGSSIDKDNFVGFLYPSLIPNLAFLHS